MPKKFLDVVSTLSTVHPEQRQHSINALDAFLSVNLEDPSSFPGQTLKDHSEFWQASMKMSQDLFERLINEEQFKEGLKEAQQKAAEQRVLLGLKDSKVDVLVDILKNNEADCRKYIAEKMSLGPLNQILKTDTSTLLQGKSLVIIKTKAARILMAKLIQESKDDKVIGKLLSASDKDAFHIAAKNLGVPEEGVALLGDELQDYQKKKLTETQTRLKKEVEISSHFDTFLKALETQRPRNLNQLLIDASTLKDYLNTNFKKYLDEQAPPITGFTTLADEDVIKARDLLVSKHFIYILSTSSLAIDVKELNKITDKITLDTFIDTHLIELSYIKDALKDALKEGIIEDKVHASKIALLQNWISKIQLADSAQLKKLKATTELKEFRTALEGLGVKPASWVAEKEQQSLATTVKATIEKFQKALEDRIRTFNSERLEQIRDATDLDFFSKSEPWMEAPQMIAIQEKAATQIIVLELNKATRFGGVQHPELIEALKSLPIKKQKELFKNSQSLRLLVTSNDAVQINSLLKDVAKEKVTPEKINKIIKENERVAGFKQIHNGALAAFLIKNTENSLTQVQIMEINEHIAHLNQGNVASVMRSILEAAGLKKAVNPEEEAEIIKCQLQEGKAMLFELYQETKRTEAGKAILTVLLNLEIDAQFKTDDKEKFIDVITIALRKNSVTEFIKELCKSEIILEGSKLEDELKRNLSQNEYWLILMKRNKDLLEKADVPTISLISSELVALRKSHQAFIGSTTSLPKLPEVLELAEDSETPEKENLFDVSGPAFDAYIKTKPAALREEYEYLLDQNNLILDRLQISRSKLNDYINSLPPEPYPKKSIESLRKALNKELASVDKSLAHYRSSQNKVTTMLKEIERVISGKEQYLYKGEGISHSRVSNEGLEELRKNSKDPFSTTPASSLQGSTGVPSEVAEKMKLEGDHKHYVYTVETGVFKDEKQQVASTKGVFIQTFDHESATTSLAKDGTIRKSPTCKVEMVQAPTLSKDPKVKEVPADAKVNFYMDMALTLITANQGKPPTKDNPIRLRGGTPEEMELLWTSLYIICKEKYKYSHAQINNSVKVETGSFNPENVMEKRLLRDPVFRAAPAVDKKVDEATGEVTEKAKNPALYHTVFQAAKDIVDSKLHSVDHIIAGEKHSRETIKTAEKSVEKYKDQIQKLKAVGAPDKVNETGEEPESVSHKQS